MKKTVTIKATNAVFIGNLPAFTGTRELELNIGDIRMAILQNAIVTEHVNNEDLRLTLENYDKDNTNPPKKPVALVKSDLEITDTEITCTKSLNPGQTMVVYVAGSTSDLKGEGTTVSGLTAETQYDVYVKATNSKGTTLSDKLTITTNPAPTE